MVNLIIKQTIGLVYWKNCDIVYGHSFNCVCNICIIHVDCFTLDNLFDLADLFTNATI
jgi:hypothetical protein